jgi:hypothetical protein
MTNTDKLKSEYFYIKRAIKLLNGIIESDSGLKVIGLDSATLATEATLDLIRQAVEKLDNIVDGDNNSKSKLYFEKDGSPIMVNEDTITPSNNAPLPVKLTSASGDINITAGDLSIQLSHTGVNFDSLRIGDGTNLLDINPDGSINVVTTGIAGYSSINNVANTTIGTIATQITATDIPCKEVIITALETNTGYIKIGGSSINATNGTILYATESVSMKIENVNLLYAIAEINNDGVAVTYFN